MYYRSDGQLIKTKIIATIGSEGRTLFNLEGNECDNVQYETLFEWLAQPTYGCLMVDAFRLNMAFYSHVNGKKLYERVFDWLSKEKELARNVGIMCDLGGGKTRLGEVGSESVELDRDSDFELHLKNDVDGDKNKASVLAYGKPLERLADYHSILRRLKDNFEQQKPGIIISVGDGKTIFKVVDIKHDILYCKVERGGMIKSNWGITFEEIDLGLPSFQRPDQEALKFILDLDDKRGFLSFVGVSFVREAEDIENVRQFVEDYYVEDCGYSSIDARLFCPDIIAKIETRKGVNNIEKILDVADGAMIARGDLALQMSLEEGPAIQKEIVQLCSRRGKFVITATEMLASMEDSAKPTRAEVNDVFNSIVDGTDAVMLSGETSNGKYPAQSVVYMNKIAERAERYIERIYKRGSFLNTQRIQELRQGSENLIDETNRRFKQRISEYEAYGGFRWEAGLYEEKLDKSESQSTTDRVCAAACELAEEGAFKCIFATTASGRTVRMISRFRPSVKVIGIVFAIQTL